MDKDGVFTIMCAKEITSLEAQKRLNITLKADLQMSPHSLKFWKDADSCIYFPFVEVEADELGLSAIVGIYGFINTDNSIQDMSKFLFDLWNENSIDDTCLRYGYPSPAQMLSYKDLSYHTYEQIRLNLIEWTKQTLKRRALWKAPGLIS